MSFDPGLSPALFVEPIGETELRCACCGNATLRIWGNLVSSEAFYGVYYVTWTTTRPDHGARFDLVIGPWGEKSTAADRQHILLEHLIVGGQPQFKICDSDLSMRSIASHGRLRQELSSSPFATDVFQFLDVIYAQDGRIGELRSWSSSHQA